MRIGEGIAQAIRTVAIGHVVIVPIAERTFRMDGKLPDARGYPGRAADFVIGPAEAQFRGTRKATRKQLRRNFSINEVHGAVHGVAPVSDGRRAALDFDRIE